MRIGDLANECGIGTQTIRFYERRGLLPPADRESNGYRVYDQHTVERVRFIQRSQAASLTLAEIGRILDVRADGHHPCVHVAELLDSKLHEVDQRIAELAVLRADLASLVDRSHTLDPSDCPPGQICHVLQPDP
jgi:MerR family mercuric resistance operon transcriptional regulator